MPSPNLYSNLHPNPSPSPSLSLNLNLQPWLSLHRNLFWPLSLLLKPCLSLKA